MHNLTKWLRMLVAMQVACIEFYDEDIAANPSPSLKAMRKIYGDMGLLLKQMEKEDKR